MGRRGLAAGLVLAMAALGAPPLYAQQPALQPVTMALPGSSMTFSVGYIADALHLWEKHGLAVKSTVITGIGAINAVISGSADFTQSSGSAFGRAAARGQRLLAIAVTIDRPFAQVVLRNDVAQAAGFDPKAPLAERAKTLKGRTIAVDSINSVIHAYVRLLANRGGFDPEQIRVTPMQAGAMLAALQTKQIDGFAISPPWPLKAVQDGEAVMIASGPDGEPADLLPFGHNLIVTRPQTCEKRPTVCQGMGGAIAEAIAYMKAQPAATLAILQKQFPTLDPKLVAANFDVLQKATPNPPVVVAADLANAENFNVQAGLLKPDEKLKSYDGLFTAQYLK